MKTFLNFGALPGAILAVLAIAIALGPGTAPQPAAKTRVKRAHRLAPSQAGKVEEAPQPWVSGEYSIPTAPAGIPAVARAMDSTAARHQLARLRMAAASGDLAAQESARLGLGRYGAAALPFLSDAISAEPDPVVRLVLEETRHALTLR